MNSQPLNALEYGPSRDPRHINQPQLDDEGFNLPPILIQYWHTVVRWRWLMAGIVAACVLIGITVTLLMAPLYTAKSQLQIDRQQKQITNVEGLEAELPGQDMEFYATQYELLKARPLAERVATELKLYDSDAFLEAHGIDPDIFEQENGPKTVAELKNDRERLVVNTLLDAVEVAPIRMSKLVDINYTSRDAELSSQIANQWAAAFIDLSMERQFASTADARAFLEERLKTLRERLEESERQVVLYAANTGIVALDEIRDPNGRAIGNRTLTGSTLEQLASELNQATAARIAAEARTGSAGGNTAEAVNSATLSSLRGKRAEVAAAYSKMLVQFAPEFPAVIELKQQLSAIDEAINLETSRIARSRSQEYREALARERDLLGKVNALKAELSEQNKANIQYAIYQREADTNRELYDALLQRYKEIGVAGTVGVNNIAIVEPAIVPVKPSSPVLVINLAIALLLGLGLAGATAFALEQIDEGIREPGQVEGMLKLPLLGLTPMVEAESVLDELRDVKSNVYDAYFSIHSNLAFSTSHGFPKSIAVTSTRPVEGKSSSSMALATILGRTGKRVLLVDADMRSPSIHGFFGLPNVRGLSHVLAGDDDWSAMVQETDRTNVSMLPAGPVPPSAAELLSGDRLGQFVADALTRYDHVVIDSPPVLGMTDAPLIANAVESLVYVVQSAGAAVRGIRASIKRIAVGKANIAGVILTKMGSGSSGYGYGYGDGYGYGYGRRYGEEGEEAKG